MQVEPTGPGPMRSQDLGEWDVTRLDLYFLKIPGSWSVGNMAEKQGDSLQGYSSTPAKDYGSFQQSNDGEKQKWMNFRCVLQVGTIQLVINVKFNEHSNGP